MKPEVLQDALTAHLPATLDSLRQMVGINSFTNHGAGVNAVGQLTSELFADLGFAPETVASVHSGYGRHLFLRRQPGSPGRKPVLLVTHLDTVFPPEEEESQDFHWRPEPGEGRIYGPGTVDIKGGTALIWLMLQGIRQADPELFEKTDWLIAANASEEVMATDFADRTAERCPTGARAVLVFEGGPHLDGGWHIVQSRKGRSVFRIEAEGKAAHAGSAHENGVNAVIGLAGVLPGVAALTNYAADLTVNVGHISGGTVINRVPHHAAAELEMRAYDPQALAHAGAAVEALVRPLQGRDAAIRVHRLGDSPAWPADEANQALAEHWVEAASQLGLKANLVPRGGLSDANYLCRLGPTLDGLGPSGGNAHCSERSPDGSKVPEFVEPASFVPKAAMNALALARCLASEA